MKKRVLHIVPHQHFDLVWRRTFDWYEQRRAELYRQVMELLRTQPEFTFTFCQVWPIRRWLERDPEMRREFSRWLRSGRIEIVGGTESICDLNMTAPAALDHNVQAGRQWLKEQFGYTVRAAAFEDAFGVSGQLPQLIQHWGYEFFKAGRMPRPGQNDISGDFRWRGLDGTVIKCISPGNRR